MKTFTVEGMSCASCVSRVEKAALSVKGVTSASASLLTNTLSAEGGREAEIIRAVKKAGYKTSVSDGKEEIKDGTGSIAVRLILSVVLLLPLFYICTLHGAFGLPIPLDEKTGGYIQLVLSLAVIAVNYGIMLSGVKALFHLSPNMNSLIAVGSLSSFGFSVYLLLSGENMLFFESAAMIPTFINIGKLLESTAKRSTTDALRKLISVIPSRAVIVGEDGTETEIAASEVKVGQSVIVRAGESVPVDGIVTDGVSAVDESSVTGESLPKVREPGDRVTASSVCTDGCITVLAERTGDDTSISDVVRLVSEASASKAPIGRLADRIASWFVPAVMLLALLTFGLWMILSGDVSKALSYGVSVLVVSCPCALGLATPVAVTVGCGKGAENGILFRNASVLELTGKVGTVICDKTGTLTEGRPKVRDEISEDGLSAPIMYSLEKLSSHPLAKAYCAYAEEKGFERLEVADFTVTPGVGVSGTVGGKRYSAVSLRRAEENGLEGEIKAFCENCRENGDSAAVLFRDDEPIYAVSFTDGIKPDSKEAVSLLKRMGEKVFLLSGDGKAASENVASLVGIDPENVVADVLPGGKADEVRKLKGEAVTAMVGDGINDAPALATADVGAAMASGTDIAGNASDIILSRSSLRDFASAVNLSRITLKIIKENLLWALIYNLIGIPIAAGAFSGLGITLKPAFCALTMSVSSFIVVTNALRIRRFDIYKPIRQKEKHVKGDKNMEVTINIKGMMCPHCEKRVKDALEKCPQVEKAEVSHEKGTAVVTLKKAVAVEKLNKIVTDAGYEVI